MYEVIENTKKSIEKIIIEDEELYGTKIDFILINKDNNNIISIISDGQEKIIEFTSYTKEMKTNYSHILETAYNFDEYLFQKLEQGYKIGYMNIENHYGVWNDINKLYPDDINYKDGVQLYLQYCADNIITKENIDREMNLDTPDIMKYFEGLTLHETLTYNGYVIEIDDINYVSPKENIINIYKSQEDFNENKIKESVSLNTINLKKNIKDYIDNIYIGKDDFENKKVYFDLNSSNKTRMLNNGIYVLNVGYRKEQPVALVKKFNNNAIEYIIAFNYKVTDKNMDWAYGYYYDNDITKAKEDFKKVLNGQSLADTFKKEKQDNER